MFVREKRINGYTYLYLVETVREGGRAKQRIIKNLGRKEAVTASGALERLATSVARYAERAVVLSQLDAGNPDGLACKRIGAPLCAGAPSSSRSSAPSSPPCCTGSWSRARTGPATSGWPTTTSPAWRLGPPPPLPRHGLAGRGTGDRSARRGHTLCPAHRQGPDRGAPVRAPTRPVQRTLGRVYGHHVSELHWHRRGDPGRARLLQGPPPRPDADDRGRGGRCHRPARLLGDVARQHR